MLETQRPRVLIVEDNLVMADIVRRALHHGGFEVEVRYNGWEALAACAEIDFDAVVTDYQMPGINGEEFIRELRGSQRNQNVDTVFVSGKGLELDTEKLRQEYGIEKVLFKPFSPHELICFIRECIERRGLESEHPVGNAADGGDR